MVKVDCGGRWQWHPGNENSGVASSTRQVLVLSVQNVEVGLGATGLLGETQVDRIDLVTALPNAHQAVIRLDDTMYEVVGVDILEISWSASKRTVLRLNLRLQKLKRSSREGPRRSRTIAW